MRIGLQIPVFSWPGSPQNLGPVLLDVARAADEAGCSSLWLMDHFFGIGGPWGAPDDPMLEGYTALAFMAAATSRLRLGLLVTGAPYRHPGILLKSVTTLDVLSGGRAYLGLGAGWYEREARGLGVPFPATAERMEHLEETLRIAHHMWRDDATPFVGRHYRLEEPLNRPQPLTRPHPPILIGGEGERQTLRMVATYGDACNLTLGTPLPGYPDWYRARYAERRQQLGHKLAVLREHCERVGRPYESIERTVLGSIRLAPDAMSAAEVVELCHELAELGIQHVIFNMPDTHTIVAIERLGRDVIPAVSTC